MLHCFNVLMFHKIPKFQCFNKHLSHHGIFNLPHHCKRQSECPVRRCGKKKFQSDFAKKKKTKKLICVPEMKNMTRITRICVPPRKLCVHENSIFIIITAIFGVRECSEDNCRWVTVDEITQDFLRTNLNPSRTAEIPNYQSTQVPKYQSTQVPKYRGQDFPGLLTFKLKPKWNCRDTK